MSIQDDHSDLNEVHDDDEPEPCGGSARVRYMYQGTYPVHGLPVD